mmetsp:Transcript_19621/g.27599  ORF Transcript_19621/g.27599 Transcript_19621/m.27599 type:complete len:705 (+) Transcript_19621:125-2239(+)|eukprot:CAMPEP_0184873704 /NCGR_PEP_ID=MMETSP0580-20130426/41988_1 /TAXON_ID=1118495 /ORGANISM="Dactyliosolen fragilissimus" /LENGTH=704 /DNA_ID=CAMNT_0027376637 /DNA_START=541 /DNA_END=2655 /DNA_ORIENTATION=-
MSFLRFSKLSNLSSPLMVDRNRTSTQGPEKEISQLKDDFSTLQGHVQNSNKEHLSSIFDKEVTKDQNHIDSDFQYEKGKDCNEPRRSKLYDDGKENYPSPEHWEHSRFIMPENDSRIQKYDSYFGMYANSDVWWNDHKARNFSMHYSTNMHTTEEDTVVGSCESDLPTKVDHAYRDFSGVAPSEEDYKRYWNKKNEYDKRAALALNNKPEEGSNEEARTEKEEKEQKGSSASSKDRGSSSPTNDPKLSHGKRKRKKSGKKSTANGFVGFMGTNFPARLHDLLSLEEDISDIIKWMPHGRSWIVLKKNEFLSRVAPSHFQISKFESFTRQVNGWGFKRITQGPDINSYYHELFMKGMPHLIQFMKRCSASRGRCKIRADPKDEPNFYDIAQLYPIPDYYGNNQSHTSNNTTNKKVKGNNYVITNVNNDDCDSIRMLPGTVLSMPLSDNNTPYSKENQYSDHMRHSDRIETKADGYHQFKQAKINEIDTFNYLGEKSDFFFPEESQKIKSDDPHKSVETKETEDSRENESFKHVLEGFENWHNTTSAPVPPFTPLHSRDHNKKLGLPVDHNADVIEWTGSQDSMGDVYQNDIATPRTREGTFAHCPEKDRVSNTDIFTYYNNRDCGFDYISRQEKYDVDYNGNSQYFLQGFDQKKNAALNDNLKENISGYIDRHVETCNLGESDYSDVNEDEPYNYNDQTPWCTYI